jgi:phosphoribosylformylglycinamidine synthase subunit PurQ / glutaminase
MQPRILILRAPGTNCDAETAYAFQRAGGDPRILHVGRVLESPQLLREFQVLCIPGGFSYGDDIGSGRILSAQLQSHLADAMQEFKAAGKLILGICNGFQALVKCGLLLEPDRTNGPPATLAWNLSG